MQSIWSDDYRAEIPGREFATNCLIRLMMEITKLADLPGLFTNGRRQFAPCAANDGFNSNFFSFSVCSRIGLVEFSVNVKPRVRPLAFQHRLEANNSRATN